MAQTNKTNSLPSIFTKLFYKMDENYSENNFGENTVLKQDCQ